MCVCLLLNSPFCRSSVNSHHHADLKLFKTTAQNVTFPKPAVLGLGFIFMEHEGIVSEKAVSISPKRCWEFLKKKKKVVSVSTLFKLEGTCCKTQISPDWCPLVWYGRCRRLHPQSMPCLGSQPVVEREGCHEWQVLWNEQMSLFIN